MPLILSRRLVLSALLVPLAPRPGRAAGASARIVSASGGAVAVLPSGDTLDLTPGLELPEGAQVVTLTDGLAELALSDGTRIHSGADTTIRIPAGVGVQDASAGNGLRPPTAALTLAGVMVIDRRDVVSDEPIRVSADGFDVELAGAQVFIASLMGDDAPDSVFVKEGGASVSAPEGEILLAAGEGIDLMPEPAFAAPAPGAPKSGGSDRGLDLADESPPDTSAAPIAPPAPRPPAVARWADDRVSDAFASVGLTT